MVRSSLPVQDTTSQLVVSQILLGCVALIPSNTLRYTALAITACFSVFCIVYLKRPSLQLRRLEHDIEATEELIKGAKFQCPRDHYSLTEQEGRLLE
jgi:hypothetical protein